MDHHQQPAANPSTLAASLTQIAGLFQSGMLTEAEFAAAKSTVLGLGATPPRGASAAASVAAPVLATVLAEEVSEPVLAAAAAAHVPSPTLSEAAARPEVGAGRKPRTPKKRKRAGNEDDPDWLPHGHEELCAGEAAPAAAQGGAAQRRSSKYVGVHWRKLKGRWRVDIMHEGKKQYVGLFAEDAEEDAARAYDGTTWRLNFPTQAEIAAATQMVSHRKVSKFVGVSWHSPSNQWAVSICHEGKMRFVGCFAEDAEEDAARAYDAAARRLRGAQAHGGCAPNGGPTWRLNFPTEAEIAAATQMVSQQEGDDTNSETPFARHLLAPPHCLVCDPNDARG